MTVDFGQIYGNPLFPSMIFMKAFIQVIHGAISKSVGFFRKNGLILILNYHLKKLLSSVQ